MPKVSIIVANYNNAHFLNFCLDSILAQRYKNFEALVFDDGSKDNSIEVINRYCQRDSRIKLIALPQNVGIAKLRSIALSHCQGEFISILDADDIAHQDKLMLQVKYLDTHPDVVLLGSRYSVINKNGKIIKRKRQNLHRDILIRWRLSIGNCLIHSSVMYRKSAALAAGGYDENIKVAEDLEFYTRIMNFGKLAFLHKNLVYWRTHQISYTQGFPKEMKSFSAETIKLNARRLLNLDISLDEASVIRHHHRRKSLAPDAKTFQKVVYVLYAFYKLYLPSLTSNPDKLLLSRCCIKALLAFRRQNLYQPWFAALSRNFDTEIKFFLKENKYPWLLDGISNLPFVNYCYFIKLLFTH